MEVSSHREIIPKKNKDKPKIDNLTTKILQIPRVELKTTSSIRTTAQKGRAFRIPEKSWQLAMERLVNPTWMNQ